MKKPGNAVDAETTIERIQGREGVVGFVISGKPKVNETGESHHEIHRKGQNMTKESAQKYADTFSELTIFARKIVRDLDPKDDLQFFRAKTKKQEVLVSQKCDDSGDVKYHIIAVQNVNSVGSN